MGKHDLAELVAPALAPGEQLLATVRVTYNGTVPPNNLGVRSGIVAIDPTVESLDPDASVSFPAANQMALALTNTRIFAWALGMTGKPKNFAGEVPLRGLAKIQAGEQHGQAMRVFMKSSAIIDLEFLRHEPAEEFVTQLRALLDAGDASPAAPADAGDDGGAAPAPSTADDVAADTAGDTSD